jgi:arylsulfatase A-like enzyme
MSGSFLTGPPCEADQVAKGDLLTQSVSHRGGKHAMKRGILLILTVLALVMIPFVTSSHAAIGDYDLSNPKDGDVDGKDLAALIAGPGPDIASFAGFFGQTYTVTARRPNILLIIGDDIGLDVMTDLYPGLIGQLEGIYGVGSGVRGNPASLPVLTDRLATQGVVFANAWAQPVCSPTRATVVTGLFEDKTRVLAPGTPMSTYHTTFVKLLRDSGYSTALFGKWHLGTGGSSGVMPKQAGFDLYKGNNGGGLSPTFWNYSYHIQDNATSETAFRTESAPTRSLPGIAATTFATVVQAADTIEWINARKAENPDKPWFVYLSFNETHSPMHIPNADTLDATSLTEVSACGTPGTAGASCSLKVRERAMANAMDTVIGKVLDAVDVIGSDNYVLFIGDNGTDVSTTSGDCIDNMYLTTSGRGKGTVYESGARVAMAVRGPGITPGSRSNEFVHVADLFATILTMAGLTPPTTNLSNTGAVVDSDSKSLTPILFGSSSTVRDPNEGYILTETSYNGNKVGARNARYKVVCSTNTSNCSFYDLVTDPLEETLLSKPGSCTDYRTTYTTATPEWHYCRLIEVVNTYSIF